MLNPNPSLIRKPPRAVGGEGIVGQSTDRCAFDSPVQRYVFDSLVGAFDRYCLFISKPAVRE